ncbi:pyruvate dehydrogenase E1 alpha subunit [Heterostelium album PN500]|uniref:Pyruvate dehydrogenase E1 component subunit alpha n=1 Tax=Heterostelium pallidum (strain ATCC 26659 / Pp 5 / PN500) TaxID=670386 RepID=D3AX60_HETP5|nr:pyruvate dehydrogenase E1 alpha subunit [Heterostelium album PN500]EFA86129.1 pyruvate dehydrogenase E1 alpha subunit [Heterostelium album PN500]|eukprot:XP_020438234.1 pyruvate dehydrogenase E1 alpha subunit [Heterostelium album PN500]
MSNSVEISSEESQKWNEEENIEEDGVSDENVNDTPKDKKMKGAMASLMKQMVSSKQPFYKMSLPICFSEPRSLLEKFTDMGKYFELFINASQQETEEARFLEILKFYLSSWLVQQDVRNPFNPVIGEVFSCHMEHKDGSTTHYHSEQISHHPPSSAFCYTNKKNNAIFHSYLQPTSKFWGNSFESCMDGKLIFELPKYSEEYLVDVPKIAVKGVVLGTLTTEVSGSTVLTCKKTNHTAEIEFKGKGLFKNKNFMIAKVRHPSSKKSLYTLEADWDGKINILNSKTNKTTTFFDINSFKTLDMVVPPVAEQPENFSRRVWGAVIKNINADNEEEAQAQKHLVEEAQRTQAKERIEQNNLDWTPKHFIKSDNTYIHSQLSNFKNRNFITSNFFKLLKNTIHNIRMYTSSLLRNVNKTVATFNSIRGFASKSGEIKVKFPRKYETYLCDGPANECTTTKEELITHFTDMTRMRRIEMVADSLYKKKLIRGFCHLYNGQEAVCTGMEAAITKNDHVITAYRDHTFMLARGATPESVLAELLMKSTGCSKGKGGSMHMFTHNFYGGNGIVGAQCPVGAGIAFTQKYNNTGNICLTYYGDGAANQGQLFEAFNMAKLWDLPCVFICENNKFGMGTSQARAAAGSDFYSRAHFIAGMKVDGMNVLAVKQAGKFVADWCRSGKGPFVLEMDTYRYVGHSMSDPGTSYRTRDEVNEVRSIRDPIEYVRGLLLEHKLATEDDLTAIEEAAREEMDKAAEFAINSPMPDMRELYTNVYKEEVPIRAVELDQSFRP